MITCPNCSSPLNFPPEQQAKIDQALAKLQPGSVLKLKCQKCGGIVELTKTPAPAGPAGPAPAAKPAAQPASTSLPARTVQKKGTKAVALAVQPPPPPSLDWVATAEADKDGSVVEDKPMALLVYPAGPARDGIDMVLKNLGYQTEHTEDADDAKERMRFVQYSCIVYRADMHGDLETSPFHNLMRAMTMDRRRSIFYLITGPDLRTLYDLEALAMSVNLTVNDRDLDKLPVVLSKAIKSHEALFGAYMAELSSFQGA